MTDPRAKYFWALVFEGAVVSELTQRKLLHEDRINPQRPPAKLGRLLLIRWMNPAAPTGAPALQVSVPLGALPVVMRRVVGRPDKDGNVQACRCDFAAGWARGAERKMQVLEGETGHIYEHRDELGTGLYFNN